jgi:hypothetical protein
MKPRKVLHGTQLPTKLPITFTIVAWLLMDRVHASGWVWGVMGTLIGILWILSVIAVATQTSTKLRELSDDSDRIP